MIGDKSRWGQDIATLVKCAVTDWALIEGGFESLQVVFAPNQLARTFYDGQGYDERDIELIKTL